MTVSLPLTPALPKKPKHFGALCASTGVLLVIQPLLTILLLTPFGNKIIFGCWCVLMPVSVLLLPISGAAGLCALIGLLNPKSKKMAQQVFVIATATCLAVLLGILISSRIRQLAFLNLAQQSKPLTASN